MIWHIFLCQFLFPTFKFNQTILPSFQSLKTQTDDRSMVDIMEQEVLKVKRLLKCDVNTHFSKYQCYHVLLTTIATKVRSIRVTLGAVR